MTKMIDACHRVTEVEKRKRQLVIGPLLQAEADRRFVGCYCGAVMGDYS